MNLFKIDANINNMNRVPLLVLYTERGMADMLFLCVSFQLE